MAYSLAARGVFVFFHIFRFCFGVCSGRCELDAFEAVEVECDGPLQKIAEAWDYLYETWFPQSDYQPADLPAMKWFARPAGEVRWDRWKVACSIALERLR